MYPARISRILRLISLLRSRRYYTANELADKLEVSKRTVYRDLNVLEQAGIPYYYDADTGGYHILDSFFLPPVSFSFEEALALILSGNFRDAQLPIVEYSKAMEKIECILPHEIRKHIAATEKRIHIKQPPITYPETYKEDCYVKIHKAIEKRKAIRCKYYSNVDKTHIEIDFEPYDIFFAKRSWYVAGRFYDGKIDDIRILKLNRFETVKMTDHTYVIPQDYSLERLLGNAWNLIRGERSYNVKIYFDPTVVENIKDTRWHPTQKIKDLQDGGIEFSVTVDGLDEIAWWILGYGYFAKVIEPPELKDYIKDIIDKTQALYRGESKDEK